MFIFAANVGTCVDEERCQQDCKTLAKELLFKMNQKRSRENLQQFPLEYLTNET